MTLAGVELSRFQRRLRRGDRLQQGAPRVLGFIQQNLTLLQRNMVIAWYQRHG